MTKPPSCKEYIQENVDFFCSNFTAEYVHLDSNKVDYISAQNVCNCHSYINCNGREISPCDTTNTTFFSPCSQK